MNNTLIMIIFLFLLSQDAENFLGITAEEFQNDPAIREKIEKKLKELCTLYARTVEKNEVEIVEDLEGEVEVVNEVVKEVVPALEVRTMDFTLTSYQTKVTVNGITQESVKLAVSNTKIIHEKQSNFPTVKKFFLYYLLQCL